MGIISTDPSGLSNTTTYYFKVNSVEYDITTGTGPTYADVATLMDTALDGAGFGTKIVPATAGEGAEDIRVFNDAVRGSGSVCVLDNGASSPDLFANLNFWPAGFRKQPVFALESSADSFVIEREMSGEIDMGGSAELIVDIPTQGTAYYADTYYKDEYYGDIG